MIILLRLLFIVALSFGSGDSAVPLSALWAGPDRAILSWQQPAGVHTTCLYRFYGAEWPSGICWHDLPGETQIVELPGNLTDPAYAPFEQDHYILEFDGVRVGETTLGLDTSHRYAAYVPLVAR